MASKHFIILINFLFVSSSYSMQSYEDLKILADLAFTKNKLKEPLGTLWKNKYWCNFEQCPNSYSKKHNCARHIDEQHHHLVPLIKKHKCKIRSCAFWYLSANDEHQHYQEYQNMHRQPEDQGTTLN